MRTARHPATAALAALLVIAAGLAGCSDSSAPRSVLHVTSINENEALSSDVVTVVNGSAYYLEDEVIVEIQSLPHDGVLTVNPAGPYGYVTIDRYEVRYEGSEVIEPFSGSLGWTVYIGQAIEGALVVVPAARKTVSPLNGITQQGEILATARITFYGRESTSGYDVRFETTLPVHFANWVD